MAWVEWFLSREFRQFVLEHNLFFALLFFVRLVGVTALELLCPARNVPSRELIGRDVLLISVY